MVAPGPSFVDFKFVTIGKEPGLLKRFSEPTGKEVYDKESNTASPTAPDTSFRYPSRGITPRDNSTRPTLFQALSGVNTQEHFLQTVKQEDSASPVFPSNPLGTPVIPSLALASNVTEPILPEISLEEALRVENASLSRKSLTETTTVIAPDADSEPQLPHSSPDRDIVNQDMAGNDRLGHLSCLSMQAHLHSARDLQEKITSALASLYTPDLSKPLLAIQSSALYAEKAYKEAQASKHRVERCRALLEELYSASQDAISSAEQAMAHAEDAAQAIKGLNGAGTDESWKQQTTISGAQDDLRAFANLIADMENEEAARRQRTLREGEERRVMTELLARRLQPTRTPDQPRPSTNHSQAHSVHPLQQSLLLIDRSHSPSMAVNPSNTLEFLQSQIVPSDTKNSLRDSDVDMNATPLESPPQAFGLSRGGPRDDRQNPFTAQNERAEVAGSNSQRDRFTNQLVTEPHFGAQSSALDSRGKNTQHSMANYSSDSDKDPLVPRMERQSVRERHKNLIMEPSTVDLPREKALQSDDSSLPDVSVPVAPSATTTTTNSGERPPRSQEDPVVDSPKPSVAMQSSSSPSKPIASPTQASTHVPNLPARDRRASLPTSSSPSSTLRRLPSVPPIATVSLETPCSSPSEDSPLYAHSQCLEPGNIPIVPSTKHTPPTRLREANLRHIREIHSKSPRKETMKREASASPIVKKEEHLFPKLSPPSAATLQDTVSPLDPSTSEMISTTGNNSHSTVQPTQSPQPQIYPTPSLPSRKRLLANKSSLGPFHPSNGNSATANQSLTQLSNQLCQSLEGKLPPNSLQPMIPVPAITETNRRPKDGFRDEYGSSGTDPNRSQNVPSTSSRSSSPASVSLSFSSESSPAELVPRPNLSPSTSSNLGNERHSSDTRAQTGRPTSPARTQILGKRKQHFDAGQTASRGRPRIERGKPVPNKSLPIQQHPPQSIRRASPLTHRQRPASPVRRPPSPPLPALSSRIGNHYEPDMQTDRRGGQSYRPNYDLGPPSPAQRRPVNIIYERPSSDIGTAQPMVPPTTYSGRGKGGGRGRGNYYNRGRGAQHISSGGRSLEQRISSPQTQNLPLSQRLSHRDYQRLEEH